MDKFIEVKEVVGDRVEKGMLHSAVVGVFKEGKQLFKYNFGCVDRQIFRLASMTKPITAVALMKCVDLGLLSVKDRIDEYLPAFADMKIGKLVDGKIEYDKACKTPITIEHILTHTSGLGSGEVGDVQVTERKVPKTLEEAVKDYGGWYLDFEPGTNQFYSALTALDIVSRIIEIVANMPYGDFLKKYIFEPLDMVDTVYKLNEEQKTRLVPMYEINEDRTGSIHKEFKNAYAGFDGFYEGYTGGAAGLFSTFEDYSNFTNMLACGGVFNGKRVLSENSVKEISIPRSPIDVYNWGYTVLVRGKETAEQPLPIGSFGWSGAYATHFFVDLKSQLSAVMMTNMNNDYGAGSPSIAAFEKVVGKLIKEEKI